MLNRLYQTNKKISTLYIILATYIMTFMFPCVTLFRYIFPKLENVMVQQFETSIQSEVDLYASRINDALSTLNNYGIALSQNTTLSTNVLNSDTPLNRLIISEEFSKTISCDTYFTSAFLYSQEHQLFYSTSNTYLSEWIDQSPDSALYYEDLSQADFIDICNQTEKITILPQKNVFLQNQYVKCLTVILPVRQLGLKLIALLPVSSLLPDPEKDAHKTMLLVDNRDQIFAGTLLIDQTPYDNISAFNFIKNHTIQKRTLNEVRYLLHQSDIVSNQLRVVSIYEYNYAMQSVNALYRSTYKQGILIFLMGAALITLGLLITYLPLKHIKNELMNVSDTLPSSLPAGQGNEWNIISMSIRHLNARNTIITEQLQQMQAVTQELFLCRYLYGDIREEHRIIEMANIYGVHIRDQIVCIAFGFSDTTALSAACMEQVKNGMRRLTLQNAPTASVSCYFIESARSAELLAVLFFDSEQELRPFLQFLESQKKEMYIGIGSYENLNHPSRSNALALAALDIAKLDNTPNLICYKDIPSADNRHLSKALEQISMYDQSVSMKGMAQAQASFDAVLKIIFFSSRNNLSIQTLYMNLYNIMVGHLNNMGKSYSPIYVAQDIPKGHNSMLSTLEKLQEEIISEMKKNPASDDGSAQIHQVLQYIAENYSDVNLSLLSISEKFGFSYSNFSHFFRKQTGSTFSNYLEHYRIDEAKRLLVETGDVLTNIAQQVGFNNIGTFTRAFKKQELITPGAYRNQVKGKPTDILPPI